MNTRSMLRFGLVFVCLIATAFLALTSVERNIAFNQAFQAALQHPGDFQRAITYIEPVVLADCRINWQISLLALRMENPPDIETKLNKMLDCSPKAVDWLILLVPQRADLAYRAAQLYPQEARIWLWMGDLTRTDEDIKLADKYFTESTRLDPYYGLAWCRLGAVKEQQGLLQDAVDAFWQCCENGDPGSNGCNGAGRVAEKLNDIPSAIRYYRRSHWQPALDRADELEASR